MNKIRFGLLIAGAFIGGFACGYSKARERFLEALLMNSGNFEQKES